MSYFAKMMCQEILLWRSLRAWFLVVLLSPFISACTAFQPKIAVDENGPAYPNPGGSFQIFSLHYCQLHQAAMGLSATTCSPGGTGQLIAVTPPQATDASALVKEGTSLAYQLCSSFFKTAGTEQQYLLFSRDVVGVAGTLATGILGAIHASPAATAGVGLASVTALSGISIYARNFLFSEDNVQAVQNLTLKAMSDAINVALQRANYDFYSAVSAIMDVQSVCEVQSILSLVRQSINQAQPTATPSAVGRISVGVPPQQPAAVIVSGFSSTSAAKYLQSYIAPAGASDSVRLQHQTDVEKAVKDLGFGVQFAVPFVTYGDPSQQAAVARKLGWSGQ